MPSQKPTAYSPQRITRAKPTGSLEPNIALTAPPVKPVLNPLQADPNKQPDAKKAAEYYAYEQNEKLRRKRAKQNR